MTSPSTPAAAHPPEPGALKRLIAKPEFGPLVLLVLSLFMRCSRFCFIWLRRVDPSSTREAFLLPMRRW